MQKRIYGNRQLLCLFLCLILLFSFTSCAYPIIGKHNNNNIQDTTQAPANTTPVPTPTSEDSGFLEVSFLDVGQGDSIFVLMPNGQTMLIDAGNQGDEEGIIRYLKGKNITKLDYVVATHPHADHIGGMAGVLNAFPVGAFYMPKKSHTTQTFEDLLKAVDRKGLKVQTAQADVTVLNEGSLIVSFLAPGDLSDSSLNNASAVIKITYKSRSFLLMGDAEKIVETELLDKGKDVRADVLKVGHHGSATSTASAFYQKVSPSYAVISCGKDNSYNHPDQETLTTIQASNAQLLRTDEQGTIVITTDGESITTRLLANVIQPNAPNSGKDNAAETAVAAASIIQPVQTSAPENQSTKTVYVTITGEKYHRNGCQYLAQSKIPLDLKEALKEGYTPCKRCKP